MRTFLKIAIGAVAAAGLCTAASATTASANFTVTANVAAACTIGATNLAFGVYTGSQVDLNSTVTATCVTGTPYTIALNAGLGVGATTSVRKLTNGPNTIAYALFSDAGHTQFWGINTGVDTIANTGTGAAQSANVYGRIAAGLTPSAGSYTDTITAIVTF